ncbi:hypothetical protein PRIPAC_74587 [Pristionchus pacificus]|uniref:Zinc finger protein n=1 Tax=Pristionchus pacificus TaxID=54126 RepID=A0A2A6C1I4_PRIPA|nr:hypothetical protein PRIPAC_74587 [Pristionchus pacificus]|eukprot:PDM71976.1 zinc finger protein [Pristionchus pacificus]
MPSVTRTPARGQPPAWLTTPIRTTRATPSTTRTRGSPVSVENCCICFSSLTAKRSATLRPCSHRYHETCVRTWMETRKDRSGQTCPMCRTRTTAVVDEDGRSAPPAFPYGDSGEPLKEHLLQHDQPENLEWLLRETEEQLRRCDELVKNEHRGNEYTEDIRAESVKLQTRGAKLSRMLQEVERGEWSRPRLVDPTAWLSHDIDVRLAQLRIRHAQLLQQAAAAARLPQHDRIYVHRPPPAAPRVMAAARPVQPDPDDWSQGRPNTVAEPFRAGRATAASTLRAAEGAAARAAARQASAARAAAVVAARQQPQPVARRPSTVGGPAPQHRFMQPTAAAAARQAAARASVTNAARAAPAAGAAGRLVAAPSRRPSTVAATPQARLNRPLPNGATSSHANSATVAAAAAAAVAVQPIGPDGAATSRFQLQPTAATLARQEAEARQQAFAAAADAVAAAPAAPSHRIVRPQHQVVRVSAAGAGPAARRRLSGQSSTPLGAPPARRPRQQQPVAEPRVVRVYINTTPSVSSEDDEEDDVVVVNYHETPRRSERIAAVAIRRFESGGGD